MAFFIAILIVVFPVICLAQNSFSTKCCASNRILDLDSYQCVETVNASLIDLSLTKTIKSAGYQFSGKVGLPLCGNETVFTYYPLKNNTITLFDKFCFTATTNKEKITVGCIPQQKAEKLSRDRVVIRKCCEMGMLATPKGCVPNDFKFNLKFSDSINTSMKNIDIAMPGCPDRYNAEAFSLLSNGSLLAEGTILSTEEFCMEHIEGVDEIFAFICFPQTEVIQNNQQIENIIVGVGIIISILFLFATLIIYLCDLKKQNLFGQTLISHIASIIVAYSCLAILRLLPSDVTISPGWCQLLACLMQYSFLATFFWLNVMSIDIWRTFRTLRHRQDKTRSRRHIKRFALYSLYAWSSPFIITLVTTMETIFHFLPGAYSLHLSHCWLSRDQYGYYIFFIAPIAAIITCNCFMFVITAYRCHKVKAEINKKRDDRLKNQTNSFLKKKDQFFLSVKLFVIMGITWSLEVISFLSRHKTPGSAWYVTDAVNILYGLIIFVIFLLKKKNIQQEWRTICFWVCRCKRGPDSKNVGNYARSTTCGPTTSTSYAYSTTEVMDTDAIKQ